MATKVRVNNPNHTMLNQTKSVGMKAMNDDIKKNEDIEIEYNKYW